MSFDKGFLKKRIPVIFLIYLFFSSELEKIYPNIYAQPVSNGISAVISGFLQRIMAVFGSFSFEKELLLLLICAVIFLLPKIEIPSFVKPVSLFLSVLYIFGESFYLNNSASFVVGDLFMAVLSIIRGLGLFFILIYIFSYLTKFIESDEHVKVNINWSTGKIALILGLVWLPQLISIFPGGYQNDVQAELMQFFGYTNWSDPHPPFFTFLIGCFVFLGNVIGEPTLGLFAYVLFQYLFIVTGVSYSLSYVIKKTESAFLGLVAVICISLTCAYSYYAATVGKDAPYSVFLLLLSVTVWKIIDEMKADDPDRKKLISYSLQFALFSLLASLIRHNGIYIAIPTFLILLLVCRKSKKVVMLLPSAIGIVLFFIVTKALYPALGVEKSMDHLIYTNQLQHTARIYSLYPEEFSEEDLDVLRGVIDLDKLDEYYNPLTSDGIKPIVNLGAPDEAVTKYNKLWLKQLRKHPFVILEASFNVTHGFFAPVAENTENDFSAYFYNSEYPELNFRAPYKLRGIREVYEYLLAVIIRLPGVRLLQNPGIYYWMFIFCSSYVAYRKKRKYLALFMPGIITTLFYLGFPAYYHHPRYSFPLVYALWLYIGVCKYIAKEKTDYEENS
ncbi:MAG: DUF6020 family protein [Acetatifactor sp.]|nr:DUF6020 family protein [Acetatifactor sp.]